MREGDRGDDAVLGRRLAEGGQRLGACGEGAEPAKLGGLDEIADHAAHEAERAGRGDVGDAELGAGDPAGRRRLAIKRDQRGVELAGDACAPRLVLLFRRP